MKKKTHTQKKVNHPKNKQQQEQQQQKNYVPLIMHL